MILNYSFQNYVKYLSQKKKTLGTIEFTIFIFFNLNLFDVSVKENRNQQL